MAHLPFEEMHGLVVADRMQCGREVCEGRRDGRRHSPEPRNSSTSFPQRQCCRVAHGSFGEAARRRQQLPESWPGVGLEAPRTGHLLEELRRSSRRPRPLSEHPSGAPRLSRARCCHNARVAPLLVHCPAPYPHRPRAEPHMVAVGATVSTELAVAVKIDE